LGDDHYRHALGYFYLAASGARIATVKQSTSVSNEVADNQYVRL
jgi:hypothetical protein